MRIRNTALALLALMLVSSAVRAVPSSDREVYREALELYRSGMYERARAMFETLTPDAASEGYAVLCALKLRTDDYIETMSEYDRNYPSSALTGRIRFENARILFDEGKYGEASLEFSKVPSTSLDDAEMPEYMFKCGYCAFSVGRDPEALQFFTILDALEYSEFTAPGQYVSGVIYYNSSRFEEAEARFSLAVTDPRFTELANFYIVDCEFNRGNYGYVVDEEDKLVGVLSLRNLMLAKPGTVLSSAVAGQSVVSVLFDTDKRDVASELAHYNYMALPVVDYQNHLMGVVTYDDIMDIMHEEASADMLGMVGADPEETSDTPWLESVGKRLPWLCVNMVNSTLSASVVYKFDGTISQMAVLAVLMPMVANQGGNSGQQALAVMIRQLATDRFDVRKAWMAVLREAKIGMLTGLVMAILATIGAWLFTSNLVIGLVMGGALLCDMVLGAVAGGSIPLVFRALGRDPAQASSIFLTTITDGAGFFIFLGLATLFLFS